MSRVLHVEVCQNLESIFVRSQIDKLVRSEIENWTTIAINTVVDSNSFINHIMKKHVDFIFCYYDNNENENLQTLPMCKKIHIYRLCLDDVSVKNIQFDNETISVARHWVLPTKEFNDYWMNLYYDSNIKEKLIHYAETTLLFSDRKVNKNIMSCNKIIFLYGPPGTGKTSLCKAVSQKLSIRLGHRYSSCEFIEINGHSLFSKWFSESGKLVMELFNEIKEISDNPNTLVCILIDEVETLALARKSCVSRIDPSDSIRVVNALLTQLDQLISYTNVFIFTTSNVTEVIDLAFVDRADLKQYIGYPNFKAVYKIYSDCIKELMRTNLLDTEDLLDVNDTNYENISTVEVMNDATVHIKLQYLSKISIGFSGRTLRKIPMLAYALQTHSTNKMTLHSFLKNMNSTIDSLKNNELA